MPELVDLSKIFMTSDRAKILDADKMRHHILECLGLYLKVFGSSYTISMSNNQDPNSTRKVEVAKSNIFLSTLRDIAAFALVEEAATGGRNETINKLFRNGFLSGAEKLQVESSEGNWLPLHWAGLVDGISSDDVRAVLGYSTFNCERDKASALHYAVVSGKPNFLAIKNMSSPYNFLRGDDNDELPIHWAATYSKDVEVLRYLVEKCPSSLHKRDKSKMTPHQRLLLRIPFETQLSMVSYLAEYESRHLTTVTNDGEASTTALHTFCRRSNVLDNDTVAIFHELLRYFPASARTCDADGALPLHYAVSHPGCWDGGMVRKLLEVYKEGATIANHEGKLPIHFLYEENSATEERLKILLEANPDGISATTSELETVLHCAASKDCYSEDKSVDFIHQLYPTAAQSRDSMGNLPLHLACETLSLKDIQAVYTCYPAAISVENNCDSTPLDCFIEDMEDKYSWHHTSYWSIGILRFLLLHSPPNIVHNSALRYGRLIEDTPEDNLPDFVRRLLLRAAPTAYPADLRELNYAERRMAMFLIFSALSDESNSELFLCRLRSLAFDYGPDMCLIKSIISFL